VRVELLYLEGCPTYRAAQHAFRRTLAELDVPADMELVEVNSNEEARRLLFPGSPTIRVQGTDLFPIANPSNNYGIGCRMYKPPEGLQGSPTAGMFKASLLEAGLADCIFGRGAANRPTLDGLGRCYRRVGGDRRRSGPGAPPVLSGAASIAGGLVRAVLTVVAGERLQRWIYARP
jgi:hypothetical protein